MRERCSVTRFLAAAVVGGASAFVMAAGVQVTYRPIAEDPLAVDGGLVAGTYLTSGLRAYFGIPFAAPPVREHRWRSPQPVVPWDGVLTANRMAPECVQRLRSSDINHYFGEEAVSEDCLYLNVWAPAGRATDTLRPVVVWIYGGGFQGGSSAMANYWGDGLAKKGVVYVSFNYRVGLFGFLAHPEATKESGHDASGNWGLLDQVAALQWVQRNIAKFGGDPGNVTIIGQSAGSMSVNYLQASPLAKGLFHKAFGMSGSTINGPGSETGTLAAAEEAGVKLQEALKATSLAAMRAVSSDRVVATAQAADVRAAPIVDGHFLPAHSRRIFAEGRQHDVPIVVGSTTHDIGTNSDLRRATTVAEYRAAAARMYGAHVDAFLTLFPVTTDADVRPAAERASAASGMGVGARSWAKAQATTGKAPAYLFRFSRTQPYVPGVTFSDHDPTTAGAYHTGDVPYWLDTQDSLNLFRRTRNWDGYDRELAAKMSDVVIAFARTGNPSTPAVTMVRYQPGHEQLVDFGDVITVVTLDSKALDFIVDTPATPSGPPRR